MPYSLHEKSGLVSVPVDPDKILEFDKASADPEKVKVEYGFLEKEKVKTGDAKELVMQVFSQPFGKAPAKNGANAEKEFIAPTTAVPEHLFPPCIKCIRNGLEDGRKRAVFILIKFLSCSGWSHEKIESLIREWNRKNKEPLRDVYWLGQLKYHKQQKKRILPPNCDNKAYYKDIRVCFPDERCSRINNPVNYVRRRKIKNHE
jgi:DNA primase large subunit